VAARLQLKTVAILDAGLFSCMLWDGIPFGATAERTFGPGEAEHGKRYVIGNGVFRCVRSFYHSGGYETFEILVEGHDRVLFHKGNLEVHSRACVICGESFGGYNAATKSYSHRIAKGEIPAVLSSGDAFGELMAHAEGLKEFDMEVMYR
jgi:hypothetical protein